MGGRGRMLVVDGYNVIRSVSKYRVLIDEEILDPLLHDVYIRARAALVADVAAYAKGRYDATVVFDGFGNPDPNREVRHTAGIDVVFSEPDEEADAVVERLVTEGRAKGRAVTVVTSDRLIQSTVFGDGVRRVSSREFAGETQQMNKRIDEQRDNPKYKKATVADRVPGDVRHALWLMAQGRDAHGDDGREAPDREGRGNGSIRH